MVFCAFLANAFGSAVMGGIQIRKAPSWETESLKRQLQQVEKELNIMTEQLSAEYTKGLSIGHKATEKAVHEALESVKKNTKEVLSSQHLRDLQAVESQMGGLSSQISTAINRVDAMNQRIVSLEKTMAKIAMKHAISIADMETKIANTKKTDTPSDTNTQLDGAVQPDKTPVNPPDKKPVTKPKKDTPPKTVAQRSATSTPRKNKSKDAQWGEELSFDEFKRMEMEKKIAFVTIAGNTMRGKYTKEDGSQVKFQTEAPPDFTKESAQAVVDQISKDQRPLAWSRLLPIILLPILLLLFLLKRAGRI